MIKVLVGEGKDGFPIHHEPTIIFRNGIDFFRNIGIIIYKIRIVFGGMLCIPWC